MKNEEDADVSFRMDFKLVPSHYDKATGRVTGKIEFDTLRYEWIEYEGERCLLDKLDNCLFSQEFLIAGLQHTQGMSIGYQPQLIDNSEKYIESRLEVIEGQLNGVATSVTFVDGSEEFLQTLAANELEFAILSVDLVGSTKLSTTVEPKVYTRLIKTLLTEMGSVVPKFNGYVLKYAGDGIIAYFPAPSFITKNDLALDCALTLRQLVYKGPNPLLTQRGMLPLDVRIGIDSGSAYVETIGDPETKQHKDILGSVVNLAAKIQSQASPGEICLGATTAKHLHTNWRMLLEELPPRDGWSYQSKDGSIYQIYRVKVEPNA